MAPREYSNVIRKGKVPLLQCAFTRMVRRFIETGMSSSFYKVLVQLLEIKMSHIRRLGKFIRKITQCYPHKTSCRKQLLPEHADNRFKVQTISAKMEMDDGFVWKILSGGKAHFRPSGIVKTQNFRETESFQVKIRPFFFNYFL